MNKTMLNSLKYSLRRSIPIMVGFFPVGFAYGVMMADAGYGPLWSAISSLFVYAGSLQMLMISFFRSTMPITAIAVTALLHIAKGNTLLSVGCGTACYMILFFIDWLSLSAKICREIFYGIFFGVWSSLSTDTPIVSEIMTSSMSVTNLFPHSIR